MIHAMPKREDLVNLTESDNTAITGMSGPNDIGIGRATDRWEDIRE